MNKQVGNIAAGGGHVAIALVMALAAGTAKAQAATSDWQFHAAVYGYLPSIRADARFPNETGTEIDVNAHTLIDHLKFAFMGSIEAQKGNFGAFTDTMYFDVGGSRSGVRKLAVTARSLPPGIAVDTSLDVKAWVWTIAASYRAYTAPDASVDVFAGARMLKIDTTFDYSFNNDFGPFTGSFRQGSTSAKATNWDGIIGAKGRVNFGARREWFVPYYLDVGTGDSNLTWQAIAGVGYTFNWGEVIGAWRYLKYDLKDDRKLENLSFSGPAIGVAFRW